MTDAEEFPPDAPEADLVEQQIPADATDDEEGLDPAHLENVGDIDANPADLIDQAISVPFPSDDYDIDQ